MITKEEYEKAMETIVKYKNCCSKCGNQLSNRWEQSATYINLKLGIDCQSTIALFGEDYVKIGLEHPAIQEGSGMQRVDIKISKDDDYKLCIKCHKEFVRMIGNFIKD